MITAAFKVIHPRRYVTYRISRDQVRAATAPTPETWDCVDCGVDTAPGIFGRTEALRNIKRLGYSKQTFNLKMEVYTVRAAVWKRVALLQREHVVKLLAARAATPGTANALRRSLRALMQHAVEIGLRPDDPTRDVRKVPTGNGEGYHSWTEGEIEQFERCHPVGSRARLAFALLLCTGQRRSDVVRMGRQHLSDNAICVRQVKTGREVWVPVHEALAPILAEASSNMTFLLTDQGRPYTAPGFGNWFRDQCRAAGLRGCSAHGLRKAAARRLAEAGCSTHEIAAITGHASLKEVARYTEAADRKRLAQSAMAKVRTLSVKPDERFDKKA